MGSLEWRPVCPVPLIVAVLVGLTALAGCGSSSSADEGDVKQAVRTFGRAVAQADGERACTVMTSEARKQLGDRLSKDANQDADTYLFGLTCADVVSLAAEQGLDPTTLKRVSSTAIGSVDVDGDSATVKLGDGGETRLHKAGGRWRVTHIGGLD
jgi:hypothetical protein